jgi:peptide/nickel transport system ATP-binding protein
VDHISFDLHNGEAIGIVGESGSGKSVTALSIMHLLQTPPAQYTSGNIFFKSKRNGIIDLLTLDSHTLQSVRGNEIGMIFQEPMSSLNPVFTCGDQVSEAIRVHQHISAKEAKEKTIALFNEVPTLMRYPADKNNGS